MSMMTASFGPSVTLLPLTEGPPRPADFFADCECEATAAAIKMCRRVPFSPYAAKLIGPTLEEVIGRDMRLYALEQDGQKPRVPPTTKKSGQTEETKSFDLLTLKAVTDAPLSVKEAAKSLGVSYDMAICSLTRLIRSGKIESFRAPERQGGRKSTLYWAVQL